MDKKFLSSVAYIVVGLLLGIGAIVFAITQRGFNNNESNNLAFQSFNELTFLDSLPQNPLVFTSNLFTQFSEPFPTIESPNPSLEGFILASENEYLQLYVHPVSLAIKVVNRATGYIFSSTLDVMADHRLNNTWRNFVDSAITIDFLNEQGNTAQESITINNSQVDLHIIENGFEGEILFANSGIAMTLIVTLEGQDIIAHIPQESITEPEDILLLGLRMYSFFGATKEDEVLGYMFIPDGSGALIRYGEGTTMNAPWRASVYGHNLGFGRGVAIVGNPSFTASVPVFGKVHGQDAFVAIIENGDNYAEIMAHTAELLTEFNWITVQFTYRYGFSTPTSRRGQHSIHRFQEVANDLSPTIRFRFLHGDNANYVGMALAYQDFLVERGLLSPVAQNSPVMRLEFLGGEMTPGMIVDRYIPMTPIVNLEEYARHLTAIGVTDFLAVYRYFASGGSQALPSRFPVDSRLGSPTQVRRTISALDDMNIPLFFHTDYSRDFFAGGFGRVNLATSANGQLIYYGGGQFFLTPTAALEQARRDTRHIENLDIANIAIETTASMLMSVFNDGQSSTRQESREILGETIQTLQNASGGAIALYRPNAYAWKWANYYFDIPMTSSRHLFVTDSVPFLQIVLRGHVSYYAPFSNFTGNWRRDLLTIIDFGAYPSFLLTSEPAYLLRETPSSRVRSSAFEDWIGYIMEYYNQIQSSLSYVRGQRIMGRTMLAEGVAKTSYENGVSIIVNYTDMDFNFNGTLVHAESFVVLKPVYSYFN